MSELARFNVLIVFRSVRVEHYRQISFNEQTHMPYQENRSEPPPASTTNSADQAVLQLQWLQTTSMIGVSITNFFLRIITLGMYHFWGKTEVRRRLWSSVRINGEPLVYTGTGKELLLGFLIVLGLVILPVVVGTIGMVIYFGENSPYVAGWQFTLYALFAMLFGIAIYRARRYRLSRTNWRGIRGTLVGKPLDFSLTFIGTAILIPLTAGWIMPWRDTHLQRILTNDTRFGDRAFKFTGTSRPLYPQFAALWVVVAILTAIGAGVIAIGLDAARPYLTPEMLQNEEPSMEVAMVHFRVMALIFAVIAVLYFVSSIVGAWYRAKKINHFAASTHYEGANFVGTATAGGLIWLGLTNLLIFILSIGILAPVVQARTLRYLVEHLAIEGAIPVDEILQGADQGITRGEGLAEAFDIDGI